MTKKLEETVAAFLQLADFDAGDEQAAFHRCAAAVHQLYGAIREAELAGLSTEAIRDIIHPLRRIYAAAPLFRRMQTWPRGYPGDFETIEYVCDGTPSAAPGTLAYFLEYHTLQTVGAQQHRNKIEWQARQILATAWSRDDARILILGCGGSRDLRHCEDLLADRDVRICLNDCEVDALRHSLAHLPRLARRITAVPGDVFSALPVLRRFAPFDLILAGGLFDYLSDRKLMRLLPRLFGLLSDTGRLCFTNIVSGNPIRVVMEYLADWPLIERGEDDIARIVDAGGLPATTDVAAIRDLTGLTHLVTLHRKDGNEAISGALRKDSDFVHAGHV
jgi:hypothetical protein